MVSVPEKQRLPGDPQEVKEWQWPEEHLKCDWFEVVSDSAVNLSLFKKLKLS